MARLMAEGSWYVPSDESSEAVSNASKIYRLMNAGERSHPIEKSWFTMVRSIVNVAKSQIQELIQDFVTREPE